MGSENQCGQIENQWGQIGLISSILIDNLNHHMILLESPLKWHVNPVS